MRRWISLPFICLALLAGCGSGDDETTTRGATAQASSASASPKVVARTFLAAGVSGRGETACSLMTPKAIADVSAYMQRAGHGSGSRADDCAAWFTSGQTSGAGTHASYRIGRVTVNGTNARATVLCPVCDHGPFSPHPLRLRRTADGWRVDFDYRKGY